METLKLTRVGEHNYGNLYRDEQGRYYVDDLQSPIPDTPSVVYRLSPATDPDGEPSWPITCKFEVINPFTEREKRERFFRFDYMMLSRLQHDCEYFLGNGNRYEGNLWAHNVADQIAKMKELWQKFPEDLKPVWCTWEQILDYEKRMNEK
jgi:hypothetical protein